MAIIFCLLTFFPRKKVTKKSFRNRNARNQSPTRYSARRVCDLWRTSLISLHQAFTIIYHFLFAEKLNTLRLIPACSLILRRFRLPTQNKKPLSFFKERGWGEDYFTKIILYFFLCVQLSVLVTWWQLFFVSQLDILRVTFYFGLLI